MCSPYRQVKATATPLTCDVWTRTFSAGMGRTLAQARRQTATVEITDRLENLGRRSRPVP